jgi:putative membrane protein
MKQYKTLLSVIVLTILYAVGFFAQVAGINMMHTTVFSALITPFILFASHSRYDIRFIAYVVIVFAGGFAVQWIGVETGRVFGEFFYGNNVGYKVLDVPIVAGLTWLVLSYCSSITSVKIFSQPIFSKTSFVVKYAQILIPLLASLLMVLVDVFIEQIAGTFDWYYWKNQQAPVQNYTAWFAFSFAFNFLFYKLDVDTDNKVAVWMYCLQLAFFAGVAMIS